MEKTVLNGLSEAQFHAVDTLLKEKKGMEHLLFFFEEQEEGLRVEKAGNRVHISYGTTTELFRGIGFARQWVQAGTENAKVQEKPVFEHLTYMVDCSRNAVCSVDYVKQLIRQMALMGYDRLMLYTEDTFEVPEHPLFGYMRGRYSCQELRELDQYGMEYGIELVPCIQTLAHMNCLFQWSAFDPVRDTGDILCCGEEKTYELIEAMIRTLSECCHSRVINIGMDEAEMIGRGNFLKKYGYKERFDIMEHHLKRIVDICKKYGYSCMMWSDMFFKMLNGERYYNKDLQITEEIKKRIPSEVELLYWDYYARDGKKYDSMIRQHKELAEQIGFAGGAWKWNGFAPLLNHSMEASRLALEQCKNYGVKNVIVTGWGDDGSEAAQSVVLPILALYAECNYAQNMEEDWVGGRLEACTGADLQDFLNLDCLNLTPDNPSPGRVSVGPAKYLFYQDPLLGIYDKHVDPDTYPVHYKACAQNLQEIADKGGAYAYIFETLAALAEVLQRKSDLGIRLKVAYDAKDMDALKQFPAECEKIAADVEKFHQKLRQQWTKENKIFGLEIIDIRVGGQRERLLCTALRIRQYVSKEVGFLEELEVQRLLLDERENPGFCTIPLWDNQWSKIVSPGVI